MPWTMTNQIYLGASKKKSIFIADGKGMYLAFGAT